VAIGLIGKKIGMSQMFSSDGEIIPVTVIAVGPCAVVQKKTAACDGYTALQIGFGEKKAEKMKKPIQGHCKKTGEKCFSVLKEFRTEDIDAYETGSEINVSLFTPGEIVKISAVSKGKGFAGNIKRWGFNRGPMAHGSKFHRACGSTGMSAWPSKVMKGKKMPGQLGSKNVTVKNIIVDTVQDQNVIVVRGSVPGGKNGIVTISKTVK